MLQHIRGQKPIKLYNHFNNILRMFPKNKKLKDNDSVLMINNVSIESPISCKDILNSTVTLTNPEANYNCLVNDKLYKIVLHYVVDTYGEYTEEILYIKGIDNYLHINHKGFSAVIYFESNTQLTVHVNMMPSYYVIINGIYECINLSKDKIVEDLTMNLIKDVQNTQLDLTQVTTSYYSKLYNPIYVNGLFITAIEYYEYMYSSGGSSADSTTAYSYDCKTWTFGKSSRYGNPISGYTDITYSNTKKLFVGCDYGLAYSEDGKVWTEVTGTGFSAYFGDPIYANNTWVVSGYTYSNGPRYSRDGKTWYTVSGLPSDTTHAIVQFAYNLWVARVSSSSSTYMYYSTTGSSWSKCFEGHCQAPLIYSTTNNLWLLGTEYYSTNGRTWTKPTFILPETLSGTAVGTDKEVKYANGVFIGSVRLSNYHLAYSEDGITWNVIDSVDPSSFRYCFNYIKDTWVAISNNKIYNSSDGKTWTLINENIITTTPTDLIVLNNAIYGLTSDKIYYSEDGVNWDYLTLPTQKYSGYETLNYLNGVFILTPNASLYTTDKEDALYGAYYSSKMEVQKNDI